MVVDKKYTEMLRREYQFPIDESLERCLLDEYGQEPFLMSGVSRTFMSRFGKYPTGMNP
jgi:hypothetical protein